MKHISVTAFKEVIESESNNPTVDFINVCTPVEFKEKHIAKVRCVPLDELAHHKNEFTAKKTIYVHCRSGNRGRKAIELLQELGVTAELVNVDGGVEAWEEAGFVTQSQPLRIPLMRQVFIGAGSLILIGVLLTWYVDPRFIGLPLFVSLGLLVSGLTGWCGMALLLGRMPWNR